MLPHVAHEQHPVVPVQPLQERVHLPRADHARLVHDVHSCAAIVGLLAPRKMTLQRLRLHACLGQLLRRTRSRRKPLHFVAVMHNSVSNSG